MSVETLPRNEVVDRLVDELLNPQEQGELFDARLPVEINRAESVSRLQSRNNGRLVLNAFSVDWQRYKATYAGTGLPSYEFDDISYLENEDLVAMGIVPGFNVLEVFPLPRFSKRFDNRMWDEVSENLFTRIAPESTYDLSTGFLVTDENDVRKVLNWDFNNGGVCADMGLDLLYERKDY